MISWTRSSMHTIPYWPKAFSTMALSVSATCLSSMRAWPLLYNKSRTFCMDGYPQVMYGSASCSSSRVVRLSCRNVPVLIFVSRNNLRTCWGWWCNVFELCILTTKTSLGSTGRTSLQLAGFFARRLMSISYRSLVRYSLTNFSARLNWIRPTPGRFGFFARISPAAVLARSSPLKKSTTIWIMIPSPRPARCSAQAALSWSMKTPAWWTWQ